MTSVHKDLFLRLCAPVFWMIVLFALWVDPAWAQAFNNTVDNLAENTVESVNETPALLTGVGYLLAIILAVQGIFKLKDHVESPNQNPIRVPLIRFVAAGCLVATPIIYDAMETLINGGTVDEGFDHSGFSFSTILDSVSGVLGGIGNVLGDINGIFDRIIKGIENLPALITAMAYMAGIIAGFVGILKLKDHVENPDQNPLREAVIRFVIGGMLFAFPTVLNVIVNTVTGGNGVGVFGEFLALGGLANLAFSAYGGYNLQGFCNPLGSIGPGGTIGDIFCGSVLHTLTAPAFLNAMSYVIGLVLAFWGITKTRDHVLNPQQVKVTEPITRFIAAALFLCLPVAVGAIRSTITPFSSLAASLVPISFQDGGYNEGGGGILPPVGGGQNECDGLDGAMACFMGDIIAPLHIAMNFFTFVVGMIFIMIGISRLIKSAQDGPKGPGGLGTFMTFFTGGALISYNEFVRVFTMTFFSQFQTKTFAEMSYVDGMEQEEQDHVHTVISAVLKFMIIVGLISFIRGLFIVRSVAEGNGQASMMAGMTHIAGGALAINLGAVVNAVQTTLGLSQFGIQFS
jgi:hypothetical protein